MDSIELMVQKILDLFAEELAQEMDIVKLKTELKSKASLYTCIRNVHREKILKAFQPYRDVINRMQKMLWSL